MQGVTVFNRQPLEAMTVWQRRVLLGALVGLAAVVNVAFTLNGPSFASSEWVDWSYAMLGGLFAQVSLLAVWAGWGQQQVTVRVPMAIGTAALLGLAAAWGEARQSLAGDGELTIACLVVLVATIQTLLLLLLRRRWGWQIGTSNDRGLPAPPRFAFSLGQLLLWTSAAAALLALARLIAPRQAVTLGEFAETAVILAITAPIIVMLSAPPVITGTWFALRVRKRVWAAAWLAITLVVTTAILYLIVLAEMMGRIGRPSWDIALEAAAVVVPIQVGLFTTLFIGLVMVRCCDFRLSRSDSDLAIAANLNTRRRYPPRFIWVAAGLAILVAILVRPAIVVEQSRRAELRRAATQIEWRELGTTVVIRGEQIVSVCFQSGLPVSDQTLAKLLEHQVSIRQLDFTGAILKDEQLRRVAELPNLDKLTLAGTHITDAGLLHLQSLGKLKTLDLTGTQISDQGLRAVEGMNCLEGLRLDQTNVTDAGVAHLQSLKGLASLSLAGTKISDEGLRQLQTLQNIQFLLLHYTNISDAALKPLRELKNLKVVTLQGSHVSPKAAAEFYRTHATSSGAFNAAAASSSAPANTRVPDTLRVAGS